MYLRWLDFINNNLKLVLGSSSEPRKQLLSDMGLKFDVIPSNFKENLVKTNPISYVENTCYEKLKSIVNDNKTKDIDVLITSDCIVTKDNIIYEKADCKNQAKEWLLSYSNKELIVYSSFCIAIIKKKPRHNINDLNENKEIKNINYVYDLIQQTDYCKVTMNYINEDIANQYINTGEWKNRAGAFAIQLLGKCLVKKTEGDFYSVIGLPMSKLIHSLEELLNKNYSKEV